MSERRYQNDEVAEIFEAAATSRQPPHEPTAADAGFTLAELQSIGSEAGISPERIAEAASRLEARRGAAPARRYMGLPISVGRTIDLPRAPTDREWEILVAELRETFGARGKDSSHGNLRQWTNGRLQALVEATPAGYRLRLGTVKSNAVATQQLGIAGVLMGAVTLGLMVFAGVPVDLTTSGTLAAMGAGALGLNAIRLPRWASEREAQMEHVAARARLLIRDAPAVGTGDRQIPPASS